MSLVTYPPPAHPLHHLEELMAAAVTAAGAHLWRSATIGPYPFVARPRHSVSSVAKSPCASEGKFCTPWALNVVETPTWSVVASGFQAAPVSSWASHATMAMRLLAQDGAWISARRSPAHRP